tara:strand:- start:255 stop:464 length:210 start_codon:yes stop_codon:yes gene_type:complete
MTADERFIDTAEEALGLTEDDKSTLRMMVCIDLLIAQAGITDEQVRMAYENRLRTEIKSSADTLKSLLD